MWMNLATWESVLEVSKPFWHIRTIAGLMIVTGQLLQTYNMWMSARGQRESAPEGAAEPAPAE
jgi:cbb3-type cytochrome oxidase subunit 1